MNALLQTYAKVNDKQRINYAIQLKALLNAKRLQQDTYKNLSIETLLIVGLYDLGIEKQVQEDISEYISLYNYENAKCDSRFNVNPYVFIFDNQHNQIAFLDWLIDETTKLADLHNNSIQYKLIVPIKCSTFEKTINKTNCFDCPFYVYSDNETLVCSETSKID